MVGPLVMSHQGLGVLWIAILITLATTRLNKCNTNSTSYGPKIIASAIWEEGIIYNVLLHLAILQ